MRKTKTVTIVADNRDKGRTYFIREMGAMQAEKWAAKALLALGRAGVEIDEQTMAAGAVAVLGAGLSAFRQIPFADAEPLLDEMMACVTFVPDPSRIDPLTGNPVGRPLIEDDIDEVTTLLKLRAEVLEVHTGFSVTAALSNLGAAAQSKVSTDTPTSRKRAASSSARAGRRTTN